MRFFVTPLLLVLVSEPLAEAYQFAPQPALPPSETISVAELLRDCLEMLRASKDKFPAARLVLANLLLKRNATNDAIAELRDYLRQPEAPQKDKVACMIERLSESGQTATCTM